MQLGYVLLYVDDVEKTVEFYETAFGLERKMVHESGYAEMATGATTLGFVSHAALAPQGIEYEKVADARPQAFNVSLLTEDVQPAYDRAIRAGARPVAPPTQKPWGQTVSYVRDLDGFLVEICSPVAQP